MATINVGDTYTTTKSHITGVVKEILDRNGRIVLRLDVDGFDKFTTV